MTTDRMTTDDRFIVKQSLTVLLIMISLFSCISNGQELNEKYYSVVSDSITRNHLLEFKNDSIVELLSIRRHMQPQLSIELNYSNIQGVLTIHSEKITPTQREKLNQYGFFSFLKGIGIEKDGKALLDKSNKVVYIIEDDFNNFLYNTFIIDGEEFREKNIIANSYGLIDKKIKKNRKLRRKLREIESNFYQYDIVISKGIDAYLKYGYEMVMGVIVINKKK